MFSAFPRAVRRGCRALTRQNAENIYVFVPVRNSSSSQLSFSKMQVFLGKHNKCNQRSHIMCCRSINSQHNEWNMNVISPPVKNREDQKVGKGESTQLSLACSHLAKFSQRYSHSDDALSAQYRQKSAKYAVAALLILCTSGICTIWSHVKTLMKAEENGNREGLWSSLVLTLIKRFTVNAAKPVADEEKPGLNLGANDGKISLGGSRRERFNFIADVLEIVQDAVVCIEVKDHSTANWFGVPQASSNGSGFIVKDDGLILTNAHVVASQPRNSITVKLHDGRCFVGFIEDVDYESDLATVRVKARGLPTIQLGCSSETRIGEWVVAVGSPLNLSNTVTAGVVSSTKRGASELGIGNDISYIQTDAAITFGNSGGPLINLDGEVVGINSMKVTSGISFAIPIDHAKKFLERAEMRKVLGKASASRRYMGLTILSLTDEIRNELEAKTGVAFSQQGVFVWQIVHGGPAYLSGLQPGDVITSINGKQVSSAAQVHEIIKTDDELVIEVQRREKNYTFKAVPENIMQ